jgi:hypothetical protein
VHPTEREDLTPDGQSVVRAPGGSQQPNRLS